MRIGIMGTGGVGGYFGGLLAKAGHEVTLIARGEHLKAIRSHGLKVESANFESFVVQPAQATDNPAEAGEMELILFVVKTYDTDSAAQLMRPMVGAQTTILPLQNGVESVRRLSRYFPKDNLTGGMTQALVSIASPGVIKHEAQYRRIVCGELNGRETPRLKMICEALKQAGADAEMTSDIEKTLWTKLLHIAPLGGVACMTRSAVGAIRADAEALAMLRRAMAEVEAVARAKGVAMDADVVEKATTFVNSLVPTAMPSILRDVLAGKRSEYDALSGAVVRAGRETNTATPLHDFFWTCLKVVDSQSQ
jgi:2-dehydropantoate 2-reductase